MRQKRAKTYRKLMHLYNMSFGFRQPYQILGKPIPEYAVSALNALPVDPTMCKTAIELKYDLVKNLGSTLQGDVKPMITQCCIHELYLQGKSTQPAVDLAKTFERRKCNHREAIPGDECLSNVVGESNKHRYVIASQSRPLRAKLRTVPAVPLLHITRAVLILEPPSDATLKMKEIAEENALRVPASDMPLLKSSVPQETMKRKRKGPKGPNPLSVKKKKAHTVYQPKDKSGQNNESLGAAKRKRDNVGDESYSQLSQTKRRRKFQDHTGYQ
ncbi:hypothetical protein APHAL10511_006243 [Amanita phalloides]|nr:hypothetical protein APHAL10511_006243 [Amanita phalloides]